MNLPTRSRLAGWLPHPALSLLLAGCWLLLQQSLAAPQLLTAALLALLLPRWLDGFLPASGRLRKLPVAARLLLVVLADIVTSNLRVARIVLNPAGDPQPAWLPLALRLRNPLGISLLASIVTTTPGTVSCTIDESGHRIIVHALDCSDPDALARDIRERYEQPLMAIFE